MASQSFSRTMVFLSSRPPSRRTRTSAGGRPASQRRGKSGGRRGAAQLALTRYASISRLGKAKDRASANAAQMLGPCADQHDSEED